MNVNRFEFELLEARTLLASRWIPVDQPDVIASRDGHIAGEFARFKADLPLDQYSATIDWIDWDDGSPSPANIIDNGDGTFSVMASRDFPRRDGWQYNPSVEIRSAAGDRGTASPRVIPFAHTINMIDNWAGYVIQLYDDAAVFVQDESQHMGVRPIRGFYLGSFYDLDHLSGRAGTCGRYDVTVDWGDGTQSKAMIIDGFGARHDVVADHDYSGDGIFVPTLTIARADSIEPPTVVEGTASIAVCTPPPQEDPIRDIESNICRLGDRINAPASSVDPAASVPKEPLRPADDIAVETPKLLHGAPHVVRQPLLGDGDNAKTIADEVFSADGKIAVLDESPGDFLISR